MDGATAGGREAAGDAEARLYEHMRRRYLLGEASGILGWDQQTVMPDGAGAARADVMAELARLRHEMIIDPRLEEWIDAAKTALDGTSDASPWRSANLGEIAHLRRRSVALPSDLVEATTKAEIRCEMIWRDARARSDFAMIEESLGEVLNLSRQAAAAYGDALGLAPYDAMLDGFEPGFRAQRIAALFDQVADFVPPLREKALARPAPSEGPAGPFPIATQEALGRRLMAAFGFDFDRGRLDVSLHPFCGGADDDVRITTRYEEGDFTSALMGVLHETGHALYEFGLPKPWRDQPVGHARGMALHESQSLFVEMQICRSPDFYAFATPLFVEAFGADASDPAWSADGFAARALRVTDGFIRVDADELSYPLHVILRTRLEQDMIEGRLQVADLPDAWDAGFEGLFGVRPPDAARGCLQDIHWPSGGFGYFPTYTLGAMAAAQLFAAARDAVGDVGAEIRDGRFGGLIDWVRENVHARASLASSDATLEAATGAPLGADAYRAHLFARYGEAS